MDTSSILNKEKTKSNNRHYFNALISSITPITPITQFPLLQVFNILKYDPAITLIIDE